MEKSILEEYQKRLEEIQKPVDMSDVSSTVIDTRASQSRDYSNDEEGYLLSEYDKRRTDRPLNRAKIVEIVGKIKEIRENKKAEEKESFKLDIKQMQEELKKQIDEKSQKMNMTKRDSQKVLEEVEVHKKALKLYEGLNSKVYQVVEKEKNECVSKARKQNARIQKLEKEMKSLQKDMEQLDAMLYEIDGRKEEEMLKKLRQEQEDKMWEEYREAEEKEKAQEIEMLGKMQEEKRKEEQKEEPKISQTTQEEIKVYDEEVLKGKIDNSHIILPNEEVPQQSPEVPQQQPQVVHQQQPVVAPQEPPVAPEQPPVTPQEPPVAPEQPPVTPQEPPVAPEQSPITPQEPPVNTMNYTIDSVGFYIKKSGQPAYYAILQDEQGKEVYHEEIGFEKIISTVQTLKSIYNPMPEDGYDMGLTKMLENVDAKYGTSALEKYQEMNSKMIGIKKNFTHDVQDKLDIIYDFSNLYQKAESTLQETKLKYIQNVARINRNAGMADYYKKPGMIKKIINAIKTKFLPKLGKAKKEIEARKPVKNRKGEMAQNAPIVEDTINEIATPTKTQEWRNKQAENVSTPKVEPQEVAHSEEMPKMIIAEGNYFGMEFNGPMAVSNGFNPGTGSTRDNIMPQILEGIEKNGEYVLETSKGKITFMSKERKAEKIMKEKNARKIAQEVLAEKDEETR